MEYRSPHIRMRDVARIYNALEVGIIITTGSGTIVWGNRYYSQLAQFDIQDYFGRNVREISRREDVDQALRALGGPPDVKCYIDYLSDKLSEVYGV